MLRCISLNFVDPTGDTAQFDTEQRLRRHIRDLVAGSGHVLRDSGSRLSLLPRAAVGIALEIDASGRTLMLDVGGVPLETDTVEEAIDIVTSLVQGRLRVCRRRRSGRLSSVWIERASPQGQWTALAGLGPHETDN